VGIVGLIILTAAVKGCRNRKISRFWWK